MNWTARMSKVTQVGDRISVEAFTAEVSDVETEDALRALLADEFEGWSVDQVKCEGESSWR